MKRTLVAATVFAALALSASVADSQFTPPDGSKTSDLRSVAPAIHSRQSAIPRGEIDGVSSSAGPDVVPLVIENPGYPFNTAVGYQALFNATGPENTAVGYRALFNTTFGNDNTAVGTVALFSNTTGQLNTAVGVSALRFNTEGTSNTAVGMGSLSTNTTGQVNTAVGFEALYKNTTASFNTGLGNYALWTNFEGEGNVAVGNQALASPVEANYNTAVGFYALFGGEDGILSYNTALGSFALMQNTTGIRNTAVGYLAGYNATGSDNVYIANEGAASEDGTIRIGTIGTHSGFFVAGVRDSATIAPGSVPVFVDSDGRLGVKASSRRYKEGIRDVGALSEGLCKLRPVVYHYRGTGDTTPQFGLIAEEVAEVYPDLVTHDPHGQVETVLYDQLPVLLLNELQQQQKTIAAQDRELADLKARLARLEALLHSAVR